MLVVIKSDFIQNITGSRKDSWHFCSRQELSENKHIFLKIIFYNMVMPLVIPLSHRKLCHRDERASIEFNNDG